MSRRHRKVHRDPFRSAQGGKPSGSSFIRARRNRRLVWAAIAFALVAVLAWQIRLSTEAADLPEVNLDSLDQAGRTLVTEHLAAVRKSPRSGRRWGELGGILKSYGMLNEAEGCLLRAQTLDPHEARWPYLHAVLRSGAPVATMENGLRKTVALCGNDPETPRLRLARLLAETGRPEEAEKELRDLLSAKPACAPAELLRARLAQARGDLNTALAVASSCTTNPYTARAAWNLLSMLYQRGGDTNNAALAARRAATAASDAPWPDPFEDEIMAKRGDARSLSDRAQNQLMAGRVAEAMPLIDRLVREHPGFPETWLLLGRALNLQNKSDSAEKALRRFLELDQESVNGHFQLGTSLMNQKRFPEAAEAFGHAITLKRDFGAAFFNLGVALVKSGKLREAIPAFEQTIQQNPERIDSYILLADLHLQLGEKARAMELAALAERLGIRDPRLPVLRQKIQQY